jgi:hypothetical protein
VGLVLGGLLVLVGVYVGALRPGRLKDSSPRPRDVGDEQSG